MNNMEIKVTKPLSKKSEMARELFLKGYGCSQAIFGAFAEDIGFDLNTALKIASGFGGGMGRMREVCGTLTGAFMVIGYLYGFDEPSDKKKGEVYSRIREISDKFKEKNETIICRQLLENVKTTKGAEPEARTDDYYKRRPCLAHVEFTAELLEDYINTHSNTTAKYYSGQDGKIK